MRFAFLAILLAVGLLAGAPAQASLPGLPDDIETIDELPPIDELLGFEPGQRHPQHHELVSFYRELAARSERVKVETIGRSHGGREHILVYFGKPEMLEKLDGLRAGRIEASREGSGPAVVWLGYSVHGNEASGASAAPVVAWYLAGARNEQVESWLENLVIVMEPVINPDGLDRFAHWVNMHRGRNPSADPNDREHNEGWPNGRTSYYWFDLNRDWLPLTHPVSRQRMAHYIQWRPHVLTDAHEMGHRSSYFFQPGIPERNNPTTPDRVFDLTGKIAEYHGRILDAAGEPFYSRESFDDYYLGKGSTYPDMTGGIGILFEQGSARGHLMQTPYGERAFADALANQVRTSISTLDASLTLADELIAHQADFFREARALAPRDGGWILADDGDPARAARLIATLLGHGIEIRPVSGEVTINGLEYGPGHAWAIPAGQDQFRLIRSIFDTPTELPMETFYDVSAWPLQHAFDLPLQQVSRLPATGAPIDGPPARNRSEEPATNAVAWAFAWNQHHAPALLAALLADGYRVQAMAEPATLATTEGGRAIGRGGIIVHSGIQPDHLAPIGPVLASLAGDHGVDVLSLERGLALDGIDLGSPNAQVLQAPTPLLLTGSGVSANAAGYAWHWFDQWLDQPLARVDADSLPGDLGGYSHIIMPPGSYASQPAGFGDKLTEFVENGGQLIALGNAASWVESLELGWSFRESEKTPESNGAEPDDAGQDGDSDPATDSEPLPYADFETDFARTLIGGSALRMQLDTTHPLAYGYARDSITVFRQGAHVLKATDNRYAQPGRYADPPLAAGYLADALSEKIASSPALAADRLGAGLVVRIADDYLFRGYWAGTEKMLANALFFGQLIRPTRMPDDDG